jgi:hypothetical protein
MNIRNQLYTKKGKKYVAYNDPYAYDGLTNGCWIVIVTPNGKTIREQIWPDREEIVTGIEIARQGMEDAMMEANRIQPSYRKNTALEQKAFNAYLAILNDDKATLTASRASISEVVDAGIKYLRAFDPWKKKEWKGTCTHG